MSAASRLLLGRAAAVRVATAVEPLRLLIAVLFGVNEFERMGGIPFNVLGELT